MGQQQLLLLVAGIIITMTSVITGVYLFTDRYENNVNELLTQEAVNIASDIVTWKQKPTIFGGGVNAKWAKGLKFGAMGMPESNNKGTKSNDPQFKRTLKGLKSKRPYVRIRHVETGTMRVDLFMYGTDTNCYKVRPAKKIDGKWITSGMKVGKNNPPAGCTVW